MGGNKHKNGIVCVFPGCDKTMRTQKFKLHFTKQHLKPGEVYNVEHRRRFEVARDEEYASDSMSPHKLEQHLQVSVQIPSSYQVAAAAVSAAAAGSIGMTPTFTPIASTVGVADATTVDNGAVNVADNKDLTDADRSDVNLTSETDIQQSQQLQQEQQQRMNRLNALQARSTDGRFGYTSPPVATATDMGSPLTNKRPASALEPASLEAPVLPSSSDQQAQDPSRAVLVQYIEMMDQRFHELIQKMGQVIDGQRELIDMLRRPFPGDTAQLLEQTSSLSHMHSQLSSPSDTLNADGSAKKRRKSNSGAELQQQQTNGTAQRPSTTATTTTTTTALL